MHLEVGTLSLILFLIYLGNTGLSALMSWSGRTFPGAWLWVGGQGLMSAGALFLFLTPWTPGWVPLVLGNGLFISACLPFAHAVWVFRFPRRFPLGLYGLVPLVLLSFTLAFLAGAPMSVRSMVYSGWTSLGGFIVAGLLVHRVRRPYRTANAVTAFPFLAIGVASVIRLVVNALVPAADYSESLTDVNLLYLVGAILVSSGTLFGYSMMTAIRTEQVMSLQDAEIAARNRKLVESGRSKDLFFSIIAHDLRGPIGGAARYVRKHLLGKMSGLEAKYNEVETLAAALDKTNEFLEKLLWWSRAQLQDWTPARVPVDLVRSLDQGLALVRSAADLKEITIEVAPPPYPWPLADPESVHLVLGNLLSNAVKFSLPGRTIRIRVSVEPGLCRITVEDEGVGMDRPTLDRLFRIEDKLTTHGTSGERGSGLGLLLARSLAERNGGGIDIESEPGIGTRASLWLPTGGGSPEGRP